MRDFERALEDAIEVRGNHRTVRQEWQTTNGSIEHFRIGKRTIKLASNGTLQFFAIVLVDRSGGLLVFSFLQKSYDFRLDWRLTRQTVQQVGPWKEFLPVGWRDASRHPGADKGNDADRR